MSKVFDVTRTADAPVGPERFQIPSICNEPEQVSVVLDVPVELARVDEVEELAAIAEVEREVCGEDGALEQTDAALVVLLGQVRQNLVALLCRTTSSGGRNSSGADPNGIALGHLGNNVVRPSPHPSREQEQISPPSSAEA